MISSKPLQLHLVLFRRYSSFAGCRGNSQPRWIKATFRLGGTLLASALFFYGYQTLVPKVCDCDDRAGYAVAVKKSSDLIRRVKDEIGAPGIVVGVSINGKTIWQEGFGYADIENRVLCTEDTVMRIASVSKSITMAAVAKLWEEGKLDLDKPVQEYVPYFPKKTFEGKKVDITCRHLISHLSGIRHYDKNVYKKEQEKSDAKTLKEEKENKNKCLKEGQDIKSEEKQLKAELELVEYYIKDKYDNVKMSLDLFKDDPLVHKPGTKFLYTTHGWTLVSAIVEAIVKEPFDVYICKLFKELGMTNTYLDVNETIIYHRSRHYRKDKKGRIQNTPYVDNSYKWAGGGFLSTVGDLLKFGNIMLYSLQYIDRSNECCNNSTDENILNPTEQQNEADSSLLRKNKNPILPKTVDGLAGDEKYRLRGYLKRDTVKKMWSIVENTEMPHNPESNYGMGWMIVSHKQDYGYCREQKFNVLHTGLAVGACSILLILPRHCQNGNAIECQWEQPPQGIVVAIISNLQGVSLRKVATEIATLFENAH